MLTDPTENLFVIMVWDLISEEDNSVLALNISRISGTGRQVDHHRPDREALQVARGRGNVINLAEKRLIIYNGCDIEKDMDYNSSQRWMPYVPVQSKGVSAYLSYTDCQYMTKNWAKLDLEKDV